MSLEIHLREREGILICDLKGRLTFGEEDLQFRNQLDDLVKDGTVRVVLNLEHLKELDSAGLGTLLFAMEKLQQAGGRLALAALQPSHMEVVMKAKLEVAFHIYEDELEAVNSFFPNREVRHYDILEFLRARGKAPARSPDSD